MRGEGATTNQMGAVFPVVFGDGKDGVVIEETGERNLKHNI